MADPVRESSQAVHHGGSLEEARRLFPEAPEPMIDLSTGINPHSYPLFDLPATAFTRLPEPGRLRQLQAVAAQAYGAPSPEHVAAGPGTQLLLPLVAGLVPPGRARILSPTYSGHVPAALLAGHDVEEIRDFDALADAALAVVVNPNNPDGRLAEQAALLDLSRKLRRRGGLLIIDEAFMDVGPEGASLAGCVDEGGIVVLRSFGKFFGLAGVRLGFALSDLETASRLRSLLGSWAVSGPALDCGLNALADLSWRENMRRRLAEEAERLDSCLAGYDIEVAGGTSLFRYLRVARSEALFNRLGKEGIFVRRFPERPAFLRCGLPPDEDSLQRLEMALRKFAGEKG